MASVLTYEEFIQLSLDNYEDGGDGYYECWDKKTFDDYVSEFGPITKRGAMQMYHLSKEIEKDMVGWY